MLNRFGRQKNYIAIILTAYNIYKSRQKFFKIVRGHYCKILTFWILIFTIVSMSIF